MAEGCPGDETVALFFAGGLEGDADRAFREHVDACEACRALLVEAGRGVGATLDDTHVSAPEVPAPRARVAPGDVIADKYRIDAILGAGGMNLQQAYELRSTAKEIAPALKGIKPFKKAG